MAVEKNFKSLNQGFIRGSLRSIEAFRNFTRFSVVTNGSGVRAEIRILAFDNSLLDGIRPGDRVDVKCRLEMRRISIESEDEGESRSYYEQRVIADQVSVSKRALFYDAPEFLLDDDQNGGYPNDANKFIVAGKVRRVFSPNDNMCILSITVEESGRQHMINAACFRRQKDTAEQLEVDTQIVATGSVVNGKVRENGGLSEMFYCKDLAEVSYVEETETE